MGRLPRHLRHFFSSVGELGLKFHVNVTTRSGLATSVSLSSLKAEISNQGHLRVAADYNFAKKMQESARNELHNSHQYHFFINIKYSFFRDFEHISALGRIR